MVDIKWLSKKTCSTKIIYDRGKYFLGNSFISTLINYDYKILTKHETAGNWKVNYTINIIHQVIGNDIRAFELDHDNCVGKD